MSSIVSWFFRKGRLVEKGSPEEIATRPQRGPRGELPAPNIIRDQMPAVQSQADGRDYDSRSALYRSYKDHGVRIVEPGEEPVDYTQERPKVTKDEIGAALHKVKQGYKPAPLEQAGPDGEPGPLPPTEDAP